MLYVCRIIQHVLCISAVKSNLDINSPSNTLCTHAYIHEYDCRLELGARTADAGLTFLFYSPVFYSCKC